MLPVVGLFWTAAVVGAGAALGWRLAKHQLKPLVDAFNEPPETAAKQPLVIDADYVDVTGGRRKAGSPSGNAAASDGHA